MSNAILFRFLKSIVAEIIILLLLVVTINNYLQNVKTTIKADGQGYYEYLPSLFIHNDLIRHNNPAKDNKELYKRINEFGGYVEYKDFKINKYSCGTAILQSPFFFFTYLKIKGNHPSITGYEVPFHRTIFHASLFYLFLSLFFFKKLLQLYHVSHLTIIISQILLVFATSVTNYVNFDASYSHIYSLFAICTFMYLVKAYFEFRNIQFFLWACVLLGLIFILRQINILIILFIPFLAGSAEQLKSGIISIFKQSIFILYGLLLAGSIVCIQCVAWYVQCGEFIIYSYQGEGFDFLNPEFINILFSYRKGLFVYTPVALICLCGLILLLIKRNYYLLFTWLVFFSGLTYVLSSWWAWSYGGCYGLRAYIEFYGVFFILFAFLFEWLSVWGKLILIFPTLFTIPLNLIQTYQYKEYILHWDNMDKESYWKIFLKQEDRFKGLLFKRPYNGELYNTLKEIHIDDELIKANDVDTIYTITSSKIGDFKTVSAIQVVLDNEFNEDDDAKIVLSIRDSLSGDFTYYHNPHLIHFAEDGLNRYHTGFYNYEFLPLEKNNTQLISLEVRSGNSGTTIKNARITFLVSK